jgi:hypothetical protein
VGSWLTVSCVLSGGGLCGGLLSVVCLTGYDLNTSAMRPVPPRAVKPWNIGRGEGGCVKVEGEYTSFE